MPMTTTLNRIREHKPCKEGWEKLLKHLGKTSADDVEFSLAVVVESNGLEDAIWCMRSIQEDKKVIGEFAWICANHVKELKNYPVAAAHAIAAAYATDAAANAAANAAAYATDADADAIAAAYATDAAANAAANAAAYAAYTITDTYNDYAAYDAERNYQIQQFLLLCA